MGPRLQVEVKLAAHIDRAMDQQLTIISRSNHLVANYLDHLEAKLALQRLLSYIRRRQRCLQCELPIKCCRLPQLSKLTRYDLSWSVKLLL